MSAISELKNFKRILVIVESPNKCSTISKILKELNIKNAVVMASVGHISEIKDTGVYNMGIDPKNKFKTEFVVSPEKRDIVDKLKDQVELADMIYICSDPDREGESIAWSLKKFLKIPDSKYRRITFHEITKKAIEKAFENPRLIDEDLVKASHTRQKLDKIVGYRLSPIARRRVQSKSVGRCQSAGLKLLVEREDEINKFVSETFYELFLYFSKNKQTFKSKYIGTESEEIKRFSSKEEVDKVVSKLTDDFKIKSVEVKERTSNPKPPFTTSTFQQEVSSKLGISVKNAMECAQKLFEGINVNGEHIALITYMRTDSAEFAPEFLPILESYVKSNYGSKYYAPVRKVKKKENVQDGHEAIRPVDLDMTPEKLSKYITDEKLLKVYDIIYKRTIATSMASSIVSETIYTIENNKHLFSFSSKELLFDGYKAVYGSFEDKDDDITTATFDVGETLKETSLEAVEKSTTPPARYKESTFIKELENKGIGRPSTFATIVETILSSSRGYCEVADKDKCLVPTQKGITLSEFLDKSFPDIININYTSELEKDLDKIASGKLDELDFLTTFYNNLEKSINKVEPLEAVVSSKACPDCGKPLVLRTGRYGEFLGCSGYPKCKHIEKVK